MKTYILIYETILPLYPHAGGQDPGQRGTTFAQIRAKTLVEAQREVAKIKDRNPAAIWNAELFEAAPVPLV